MNQKITCKECSCRMNHSELLTATNPFDPDQEIHGCPACKCVDCFSVACDEPGCWEAVSCGTPVLGGGYRHTCGRHRPMKTI